MASSSSRRTSTSSASSTATVIPRSSLSLYPSSPLLTSPFTGSGFFRSGAAAGSPTTPIHTSFASSSSTTSLPFASSLLAASARSIPFEPPEHHDDEGAESAVESIDGVTETETEEGSSEEEDSADEDMNSADDSDMGDPLNANNGSIPLPSMPLPSNGQPLLPFSSPLSRRSPPSLVRTSTAPSLPPVRSLAGEHQSHDLYGAYKQATVGNVKGPKPAFFDINARSKWQAWANLRGKSKDEAKAIYINIVDQSLRRAASEHPELNAIADEITGRRSSYSTEVNGREDLEGKPLPPAPRSESESSSYETAHTTPTSTATATPALRPSNDRPYGFNPVRKGSISHSIASATTGLHSAAASVYELANDQLVETAPAGIEGGIKDDLSLDDVEEGPTAATMINTSDSEQHDEGNSSEEEEEDDDVYQSSEEYGDEAEIAAEHEAARLDEEHMEREQEMERNADMAQAAPNIADAVIPSFITYHSPARLMSPPRRDDLIDEGVFDEEDKIEDEAVQMEQEQEQLDELFGEEDNEDPEVATILHRDAPAPVVLDDAEAAAAADDENALGVYDLGLPSDDKASPSVSSASVGNNSTTKSRTSSMSSSGYGGSVTSKGQSPVLDHSSKGSHWSTLSSKAEQVLDPEAVAHPYVVRTMAESSASSFSLSRQDKAGEEMVSPPSLLTASSTSTQSALSSNHQPSPSSFHAEGAVCPVTKRSAADGMCPAAMFAAAREARQEGSNNNSNSSNTAAAPSMPHLPGITRTPPLSSTPSVPSSPRLDDTHAPPPKTTSLSGHGHSQIEPVQPSPASSSPSPSQSKRLGQGIVSRISALRSSLATASARAASSALSSFPSTSSSSSSSTLLHTDTGSNVSRMTAVDPLTNQSVTVICPHGHQTAVFERELVQLQNEVTALTERLRMLQESLEIKSQTQAQEKRSARGILKLILRQGLINAVLLLIVFAVLYKRKSPIAFAILAYVGQGRKEGEAGWRALMRWFAQLIRIGRRNQRYVLTAGRRNGYW